MSRQNQMPHNHSFLYVSVFIEYTGTCLLHHSRKSLCCFLRIIFGMGIHRSQFRIHVLKIRQPDIHQTIQHFYSLRPLISTCIVDHRNLKSLFTCGLQCRYDCRKKMGCRHQIDIGSSLFLQFQKNLTQPLQCDFSPADSFCNLIILTEHTSQRTSGKEYSP